MFEFVTIITENEYGCIGSEEWTSLTAEQIKERINMLSDKGWEVVEIQHGESQDTLILEDLK